LLLTSARAILTSNTASTILHYGRPRSLRVPGNAGEDASTERPIYRLRPS
jgi:hypothetical protein